MKYGSNFNVLDLIKLANKELRTWSAFRFKENAIRVEATQFFHPKSQDSIAEVQVGLSVE
jgi:hypothetical protein